MVGGRQLTRIKLNYIFDSYLVGIWIFLLFVGVQNEREHAEWSMGDWVINYSSGFVRRGLIGEGGLLLGRATHISIFVWILFAQLIVYVALLFSVRYLVRLSKWSLWKIAVIYSPAALSFTLFDPRGGFRKEILFIAVLALLIVALLRRTSNSALISVLLMFVASLLILSHEAFLLYFPYLFCGFLIAYRNVKKAIVSFAPAAISGLGSFIIVSRHPGTPQMAKAICLSTGEHSMADAGCRGAIAYIAKSSIEAHRDVLSAIHYWHLKVVMPYLMILAVTPVIFGLVELRRNGRNQFGWWSLVLCAGTSWVGTIALFYYGLDWNRWIYLHVFSSMLLMLALAYQQEKGRAFSEQQPFFPRARKLRYGVIVILAFSLSGWQLAFYHHFPLPAENLMLYLRSEKRAGLFRLRQHSHATCRGDDHGDVEAKRNRPVELRDPQCFLIKSRTTRRWPANPAVGESCPGDAA